MKICRQAWFLVAFVGLLVFSLSACGGGGGGGGSPERYDPGPVAVPTGVTAMAGNGEVALIWPAVQNAAAYKVYWSTSPTVDRATASVLETPGTSITLTGLTNGVDYYFTVTAVAAYTETAGSSVVTAQPTDSYPGLVDLDGTWNFNILVSGQEAGWMRGQISISNGVVSFLSFLDSSDGTVAPTDLFGTLSVLPDGSVSQAGSSTTFVAQLSNLIPRSMMVGTAAWRGNSTLIAVLQKQVPGVTFPPGVLQGLGGSNGPKFFVFNQISSGVAHEWEFAVGKLSQSREATYLAFTASDYTTSTFPTITTGFYPSDGMGTKVATLSIDQTTGEVTETVTGTGPIPQVTFRGFMSADLTIIVGTFTDTRFGSAADPASRKYNLRIYQIVNPFAGDFSSPPVYDLSKPYNIQKLAVGAARFSAYGTAALTNATSGIISYSSYTDTLGGSIPADSYFEFTRVDWNSNQVVSAPLGAILTNPGLSGTYTADPTFFGKVSRYSYLAAWTKTEASGARSLAVGIQKAQ